MKLGVAYNIFDGEELLPFSLRNIRPMVDFICVVYQTTSNFKQTNPTLEDKLNKLKSDGLIDKLYSYEPNFKYDEDGNLSKDNGILNEINKRNIGLDLCALHSCDAFMSMDCDEFYNQEQFQWAKTDFENNDYDTSFTQMRTYYKHPTLQLSPPETYYAPLFYKLNFNQSGFDLKHWTENYPVQIDPTRRVRAGYSRVYSRDEIEMHHFAYVRNEFVSKVQNSSSQTPFDSKQKVIDHYMKWESIKDGALLIGGSKYDLIEVENQFKIEL
jgi:hypothetical protein